MVTAFIVTMALSDEGFSILDAVALDVLLSLVCANFLRTWVNRGQLVDLGGKAGR